jgi:hypothetical protein
MPSQDNLGQPEQPKGKEDQNSRATSDAQQAAGEQQISLSTQQAAAQLGRVDSRTVRRWISDGVHLPDGTILYLKARHVQTKRGPVLQIYQEDLEEFKAARDRAATEGLPAPAGETRAVQQESQSQAISASIQLFAAELERRSAELERRSLELAEAQAKIERLAYEAGRQQGRNEVLERELEAMRQHAAVLQQERDHWQQQATQAQAAQPQGKPPRRIRLLGWRNKGDDHGGQQ